MTMFEIGALCRGFLLGFGKLEVNGLERFTELLDSRRDPSKRTRGLITGKLATYSWNDVETNYSLCQQYLITLACTYVQQCYKIDDIRQVADLEISMDDPLMWGALPLKYHFNLPSYNRRWGFGSHDICWATR